MSKNPRAVPGDNSKKILGEDDEPVKPISATISAQRLQSFVSRVERLADEKSGLAADIREVLSEAKSAGFNTKVIREVIKLRKQDKAEREERQAMIDLYMDSLVN